MTRRRRLTEVWRGLWSLRSRCGPVPVCKRLSLHDCIQHHTTWGHNKTFLPFKCILDRVLRWTTPIKPSIYDMERAFDRWKNDRRLFLSILTLNHVNSRSDRGSPMKCDRLRFVRSVLPGKNLPAFPRMQQALLGRSMTQELGTTPSPKRIFMPPVRSVSNLVSSRAYQRGTCAQSDAFV